MSLGRPQPQMSRQLELSFGSRGEAPRAERSGEGVSATHVTGDPGTSDLMEAVVHGDNLRAALKRVRKNKGSPGIDAMTVGELPDALRRDWPALREQLLTGNYQPRPVKRVAIPKSGGGSRELGIPTVLDRLIQQGLLQVLQPMFDAGFSEHSHGFRPGRGAHGAIRKAQHMIQQGRHVVVDADLSKFFDRVNHDVLMGKLAKHIADKRVLKLIRRFLEAGMMSHGVVSERRKGTPQGGPLSPLLANILLDEVDKELEWRGHAFVRYADDLNVYVRSQRAGERVMKLLRRLYGRLHLIVNEDKSAVAPVWTRQFLGYAFWRRKGRVRLRVARKSYQRLKERLRLATPRVTGRSIAAVVERLTPQIRGWKNYFRLADGHDQMRRIDGWLRRRLRAIQLKQWTRGTTAYRRMRAMGWPDDVARYVASRLRRGWWNAAKGASHMVFPKHFFDDLGLPRLAS